MTELRRNRGPDDGDKPADKPSEADNPTRRPSMEFRTSDQLEGREVDRRKLTPVQRDFIRTEKEAAESGVPRRPITTYSMDWATGEHVDGWYDPPARDKDHLDDRDDSSDETDPDDSSDGLDRAPRGDTPAEHGSPYAEPPADFHRDDSGLEARTLERTDAAPAENYGEIALRGKADRRARAEVTKQAEKLASGAKDTAGAAQKIHFDRQPPGQAITRTRDGGPAITSEEHAALSLGDLAATAVATGLVLGAAANKIHETYKGWKDRRAGNE